MPLVRLKDEHLEQEDGVRFLMADELGNAVACKVSHEALRAHADSIGVISELMIKGHVDCCRRLGERMYITNGSQDCVMVFRLEGNKVMFDHELSGYHFLHGIDLLPGLLAVTNYGSNTIVLTQI
jgi:hypothetical protein